MVIPDSSVWIPYFRTGSGSVTVALQSLLERDLVLVPGVVLTEVLAGARSVSQFEAVRRWMTRLPCLEPGKEVWAKTGDLIRDLRTKGVTLHIADGLIATLAIEGGHAVYTFDTDFHRIPGLKLYEPSPE